ncbi:MAG TPA: TfoX/Sxy family protein [Pseudomonas sp.]|jgi:TfoX/Sxy family transcriptional regulator of competence genes|uniref:TfoX/Sxy family protein n=1 Tax=Pseudomonas sp. TaxID=306 RepID=UPI002BD660F6|nr:TfoX/Sxy family protein [Pseudomonas sp.]HTN30751.1 TfoX/Sxy family protein [Pseudomonas sp.]HTO17955.1 TfoX/Sxy family protein [Pseudomonas sp.]
MNDELLRLKNLGKTSALWLHASGIHNLEDLRRLGSVAAYRAVLARGFRASRVLLYAIEGALLDIPWSQLPHERKTALNQALERRPPTGVPPHPERLTE